MESQVEMLADYFSSKIVSNTGHIGKIQTKNRDAAFLPRHIKATLQMVDQSNHKPRDLKRQWKLK